MGTGRASTVGLHGGLVVGDRGAGQVVVEQAVVEGEPVTRTVARAGCRRAGQLAAKPAGDRRLPIHASAQPRARPGADHAHGRYLA
jgi:hypothetical protein